VDECKPLQPGYLNGQANTSEFFGPNHIALSPDGRTIVVVDSANDRLRYVDLFPSSTAGGLFSTRALDLIYSLPISSNHGTHMPPFNRVPPQKNLNLEQALDRCRIDGPSARVNISSHAPISARARVDNDPPARHRPTGRRGSVWWARWLGTASGDTPTGL